LIGSGSINKSFYEVLNFSQEDEEDEMEIKSEVKEEEGK
tara:strand:- start:339 stop:455 length:117 start_codon:yes stop_codon:yes gene_type:complete